MIRSVVLLQLGRFPLVPRQKLVTFGKGLKRSKRRSLFKLINRIDLELSKKNREEEMAMGLEYEVGTIGTDIIMLQEDIKMVS